MTLGDARWEATHGRIGTFARWRYALAAVAAQVRMLVQEAGVGRRTHALERLAPDRIVYPDSTCAKAALEKLSALASPALTNHSLRTYIWGSLLGQLDGKRWDEEIFFVAAMLHDLGLTEALHGSCAGAQCFTLDGIHAASEIFAHTTHERAERMRRAVLLHLNIEVPGDVHGWEAHYLRAGAALDVVGQRHRDLPRETIQSTLRTHPRLNLENELGAWVRRESRLRPMSRTATLDRLGFRAAMRRTPFDR